MACRITRQQFATVRDNVNHVETQTSNWRSWSRRTGNWRRRWRRCRTKSTGSSSRCSTGPSSNPSNCCIFVTCDHNESSIFTVFMPSANVSGCKCLSPLVSSHASFPPPDNRTASRRLICVWILKVKKKYWDYSCVTQRKARRSKNKRLKIKRTNV